MRLTRRQSPKRTSPSVLQLRNYGDQRQVAYCCHCGGATGTRDHVPSKVFLDVPYPPNIPVVPACERCNRRFSLDEQYVACLIESALCGSTNPTKIGREKIQRILSDTPALVARLEAARHSSAASTAFSVEIERVRNVVLKLARGHALFETNEPQHGEPDEVWVRPLVTMSSSDRRIFETPPVSSVWPEVGSRSMQRIVADDPDKSIWLTVQPDRYRYLTAIDQRLLVRGVISEYLAYEVTWH